MLNLYKYNSWNEIPTLEKIAFEKTSNWCWWNLKIKKNMFFFKKIILKMLNSIKPPLSIFFFSSCAAHDWWYAKGGNFLDKLKVDIWFLKYMLKDVFSAVNNLNIFKKIYYSIWSIIYFIIVLTFWIIYFDFNKKCI